jgi:hypothetical protein
VCGGTKSEEDGAILSPPRDSVRKSPFRSSSEALETSEDSEDCMQSPCPPRKWVCNPFRILAIMVEGAREYDEK